MAKQDYYDVLGVQKSGSLAASVAAGILAINRYHGGAIEDCARQLAQIAQRCESGGDAPAEVAGAVLDEMKKAGRRMSGFGHRVHTSDPRTQQMFELAVDAGVDGRHMKAACEVERVFAASGRKLPMNVDGAIAAVLADMGFEPASMNGQFMIARVPGLIAHALEERERERPMRRIEPGSHEYDGPTKGD